VSANQDTLASELSVEPGTQVLLSVSSMQSPLDRLPASACRNLVVVSSASPGDIAERLTARGIDLRTVALIPISGADHEYEGPMWTCDPLVPDDLTGLSMRLSRAFEALGDGGGTLLVENLNVFLLYADESRVVRFLDHVTGLAADHGISGVYAVVGDAVDEETYNRIAASVDSAIDCA